MELTMRVLRVVLALVAIPFVAVLAQRPFEDAKNCGIHLTSAEKANARAGRGGAVLAHDGRHGVMDRPCEAPAPPPADDPPPAPQPPPSACAVSSLPVSGSLSIVGRVRDAATGVGLAGWCVQLFTEAGTAVAESDASGNYVFANLPDGTYLICEDVKDGWQQTFPSVAVGGVPCPTGFGHQFPLGGNASNVDFKNLKL
jgi:hypothetical protein